jgi:NHS family xanthosine MFS transporter
MMMTNGVGAYLGSKVSGYLIDEYYTLPDGNKDWHEVWLTFAMYALAIAVAFLLLFKHKHDPKALQTVRAEP